MNKDNNYLSNRLHEYADLLQVLNDNQYKVKAYRKAAYVIKQHPKNLYTEVSDFTQLPHVGKGIALLIQHLIRTDSLPEIKNNLEKKWNELVEIKGLGPKTIRILNEKYQIFTRNDLLKAIKEGKLSEFGVGLIAKIEKNISIRKKSKAYLRLYQAIQLVDALLSKIKQIPGISYAKICGDYRRKQEIVEQLILVIVCINFKRIINAFKKMVYVKYVLIQNDNLLEVQLINGMNMSIYRANKNQVGASVLCHTGSNAHIAQLTQYAKKKELILNKHGIYKKQELLCSDNEENIYKALGLQFISPELREARGEIEAAAFKSLPKLIQLKDIRGDLHSHTNETDGQDDLETMVNAAAERGYEYLAITDHSKSLKITHGMDEKRLFAQIKQIDALNNRLNNILILKSIEVDILEDGSLDLSNDALKELDIVVCSVHSKFKLDEAKQTQRILKAMDNPYFHILGHATGRLIKSRPPYFINLAVILKAAKERNCFIELNAQPYRLDINDVYCKLAKEMGVKIAISSDAHTYRGFRFMELGVHQARRGWLEKEDVINTRTWPDLKKLLRKP